MGLAGFEPATPALSRRCSNRLSYRPTRSSRSPSISLLRPSPGSRFLLTVVFTADKCGRLNWSHLDLADFPLHERESCSIYSRKEVIQPHLPIRLPCYDFTPVTNPAVVIAPLAVRLTTSGRTRSHGVTGGVYKTRERIHRGKLIRDY